MQYMCCLVSTWRAELMLDNGHCYFMLHQNPLVLEINAALWVTTVINGGEQSHVLFLYVHTILGCINHCLRHASSKEHIIHLKSHLCSG